MGFVARVCQPSTLRMLIWPAASSAQNNMTAVSADGRLDSSLELFVQSLDRIRGARAAPLARRQPSEGEQAFACFLQAVGDGAVLEAPLADEGLATDLDLLTRGRIDHVVVVRCDLIMQTLGRMRQQVPMLVNLMPTSA